MFELSFVYVLFEDGTDIYWARSRVLEYLNFARDRLPAGVEPKLGPDATGVGWVYQYVLYPGLLLRPSIRRASGTTPSGEPLVRAPEDAPAARRTALVHVRAFEQPGTCPLDGTPLVRPIRTSRSCAACRTGTCAIPLTAVDGVSEVAAIGGFVRQYQVVLDPRGSAGLPPAARATSSTRSSARTTTSAARSSSWREHEYMVRSRGYLRGLDDLAQVVGRRRRERHARSCCATSPRSQIGGEMRRGVGEYNGIGRGRRRRHHLALRRERLQGHPATPRRSSPSSRTGCRRASSIKTTYDRSALIERAVGTLREAVIEELVVVALICLVFLAHVPQRLRRHRRPAGRARWCRSWSCSSLGINANIMSLGGLALAIGVMVDSAVVMIENAHKHLERGARARRRAASRRKPTTAHHPRGGAGGGPEPLLLAAHHHRRLPAHLRARRPVGPAVQAARLHQDLRHRRRRHPRHHDRAGADGLPDPRPHPGGGEQPDQPLSDGALRAGLPRS